MEDEPELRERPREPERLAPVAERASLRGPQALEPEREQQEREPVQRRVLELEPEPALPEQVSRPVRLRVQARLVQACPEA